MLGLGGLAMGVHLFPFRTQKLSPSAPMIVLVAKVGCRQDQAFNIESLVPLARGFRVLVRYFIMYTTYIMSLSWGRKKQIFYFSIVAFLFISAILFLIWPYLNKEPTCFDGKQNGGESGIDCGGNCQKVCTEEALNLVTLWSRAFRVTPGKYNLMAYVENQNRESGVPVIMYEFKVYDEDNIFIGRTSGTTFITSNDRIAVFASGVETGNRIPKRVSFEFTSAPTWIKVSRDQRNALAVSAEDKVLSNPLTFPKLEAVIVNKTINEIKNLDVYAILYDEEDNVINVSKTLIDILPKNGSSQVVFTWPEPLSKRPARIDVFPQINIFELEFEE